MMKAKVVYWLNLAPDEAYLPGDIHLPYGYYESNKNRGNDGLVMIDAEEAVLGGNRYHQVIFFSETHS